MFARNGRGPCFGYVSVSLLRSTNQESCFGDEHLFDDPRRLGLLPNAPTQALLWGWRGDTRTADYARTRILKIAPTPVEDAARVGDVMNPYRNAEILV